MGAAKGRPRKEAEITTAAEIYEGEDGLWHGWVEFPKKPDGSRDRRHRKGRDKKEVQRKVAALEKLRDEDKRPSVGRPMTVREWFTHWLTQIAPFGEGALRESTLADYKSKCRIWVYPHLGGLSIGALSVEDLDKLYSIMRQRKKSGGTILKVHAIIRSGLAAAIPRGKIPSMINVAAIMRNPAVPAKPQRNLDVSDADAILDAVKGDRLELLWWLRLALGPRQGTLLAITWDQVDLDECVIDLAWQYQRRKWLHGCDDAHACGERLHRKACPGKKDPRHNRDNHVTRVKGCPPACERNCTEHASKCPKRHGGGIVRCRPKQFREGDTSHLVAFPRALKPMFEQHKFTQDKVEKVLAGDRWEDNNLVFCQQNGRPIGQKADYEAVQDVSRRANIGQRGTHWYRAFTATYIVESGETAEVAADVLGHADSAFTKRIYVRASEKSTRRAADAVEGLFKGRGATRGATLATHLATGHEKTAPDQKAS